MREIYLDNSATTMVHPKIAELMVKIMCEDYGNPSSMHNKGVAAESYLKSAKESIAKILKVSEKELFFTSCGTESDNMAIIGTARANVRRGKHIITSKIEHPAVLNAMKELEEEGFQVTYLGTDEFGRIRPEDVENAIKEDTILVSIMNINNEVGSVQPVEEIGALIKGINPNIYFHVDAVQSFGKAKILPKKMNIDMLSVSGHKIHAPKGIGLLYISDKVKLKPIIYGGGQQNGYRSGTENVAGIAALGMASELLYKNLNDDLLKLYGIKCHFIKEALKIEGVSINGIPAIDRIEEISIDADNIDKAATLLGAPHVISVSVRDVRAEVLLHALEDKGIYVSAGSACSTHKRTPSATLTSINLDKPLLESTVRFSTSIFNSIEDIDEAIAAMADIIPLLRKYTRH